MLNACHFVHWAGFFSVAPFDTFVFDVVKFVPNCCVGCGFIFVEMCWIVIEDAVVLDVVCRRFVCLGLKMTAVCIEIEAHSMDCVCEMEI